MMFRTLDRALRTAFAAMVSLCLAVAPALPQAALLPNAKQTFLDSNGNPLTGGKVYSYVPNTSSFKTTWTNSAQTTSNTNPVVLDSAGRAVIYGQGSYQQRVTDALDNLIWNAPTTAYGSSAPTGATGTDTAPVGTIMAFSGFVLPTNWQYADGTTVSRTDFSELLGAITVVNATVSCTSSSTTLSGWVDTSILKVGTFIEASCVPTGTQVTGTPTSSTITVNNAAVSTGTVSARAFPWGNGNGTSTFTKPDLRGRVIAAPDSMGGTAANVLTSTYYGVSAGPPAAVGGAQSHSMTTAELVAHNHVATSVVTDPGHLHAITDPGHLHAITDPGHVHAITDPGHVHAITDPGHVHTERASLASVGSLNTPLRTTTGNTGSTMDIATESITTGITINSNNTGISVNSHTTGLTVNTNTTGLTVNTNTTGLTVATTTSNRGSTTPFTLVQPTLTANYIIKVKSNTTGAGGVVSLGGMIGDIVCDATFLCSPQGSPAVNTIGLAGQPHETMLANVGPDGTAPVPLSLTEWMDSTCGLTRGMLMYRGASTWRCLPPLVPGATLALSGSLDPEWSTAAGTGTVTSVGLALPAMFSVSGSPVTGSGTLTGALAMQVANRVFAGPSSGGAATPTFRSLVAADIGGCSGTPSSSTFLRGDCAWATPAGGGNVVSSSVSVPNNAFVLFDGTTGTVVKDSSLPVLLGNTTFWVRTDGNDSNSCLNDTATAVTGACATWQGAYDKAAGYFWNNYTVTLKQGTQVGVKTYTTSTGEILLIREGWRGGGNLNIEGDDAAPSNVVLQTTTGGGADVFRFATTATFSNATITGFKLVSTGDGVRNSGTGTVYIGNMELGTIAGVGLQVDFAGAVMYLSSGKTIDVTGPMAEVFDFDSGYIGLSVGATIIGHGQTVGAVMVGRFMGRLWSQATWSGTFVGASYVVRNGVHLQFDSETSPLPGTDGPGVPIGGGVYEDTFTGESVIGIQQVNFGNGVTQTASVGGGVNWVGATAEYKFDNQLSVYNLADNAGAISTKYPSAGDGVTLQPSDADVATAIRFRKQSGTTVGSISVDATSTSYNTSSDGRMKPIEGRLPYLKAREIIDALKVYDYARRDSQERGVGVVAQDAAKVFPLMVTKGDNDPNLDPRDPRFKMWQVDYSKFVPVLITALQEANRRIDALEGARR